MKAFVVSLNGEKLCTAGIGKHGVLSAHVTWVGGPPHHTAEGDTHLIVGGLDPRSDEHLRWTLRELEVGDSVTVEVIETDTVDYPEHRHPSVLGDGGRHGPLMRAAWFVWDLFDREG